MSMRAKTVEFNKIKQFRFRSAPPQKWEKAIMKIHNFHRNCFLSVNIKHIYPRKKMEARVRREKRLSRNFLRMYLCN